MGKLSNLSSITSLDLSNNNLGTDGCRQISDVIRQTETIEELILRNNKIGPEGLHHICDALAVNKSIRVLVRFLTLVKIRFRMNR